MAQILDRVTETRVREEEARRLAAGAGTDAVPAEVGAA
jgi:hypothetical protein